MSAIFYFVIQNFDYGTVLSKNTIAPPIYSCRQSRLVDDNPVAAQSELRWPHPTPLNQSPRSTIGGRLGYVWERFSISSRFLGLFITLIMAFCPPKMTFSETSTLVNMSSCTPWSRLGKLKQGRSKDESANFTNAIVPWSKLLTHFIDLFPATSCSCPRIGIYSRTRFAFCRPLRTRSLLQTLLFLSGSQPHRVRHTAASSAAKTPHGRLTRVHYVPMVMGIMQFNPSVTEGGLCVSSLPAGTY